MPSRERHCMIKKSMNARNLAYNKSKISIFRLNILSIPFEKRDVTIPSLSHLFYKSVIEFVGLHVGHDKSIIWFHIFNGGFPSPRFNL
jgi:hypothetical protein